MPESQPSRKIEWYRPIRCQSYKAMIGDVVLDNVSDKLNTCLKGIKDRLKLDGSFRPFFYRQICNIATLQRAFAPIYRPLTCNTKTCCMQPWTLIV